MPTRVLNHLPSEILIRVYGVYLTGWEHNVEIVLFLGHPISRYPIWTCPPVCDSQQAGTFLSKCDFSCPIWGANIMQILVFALVDLTHEHSIRPCSQFMKKIRSSLFTPFMYIYI